MSLDHLVFQAPHFPPCSPCPSHDDSTRQAGKSLPTRTEFSPEPAFDRPLVDPPGECAASGERRPKLLPVMVLAMVVMLTAVGCAKPPIHPWVARDGLVEIETYNRGQLFIKRDHQLGKYDNLLVEHVGFRYGEDQERLAESQEDRIVSMLMKAVRGSQDGQVGVVALPGPCVLTVNFFLKDLEFEIPDADGKSETNFVSSYGAATMVLELRDSMNQEPLARFIQRRDLGGGRVTLTQSMSLRRLGSVMSFALRDMGNQLRKVIPPTAGRADRQSCHGGMAQVALGSF